MSASAQTATIRFRTIATSIRAPELLVCLFGGAALAFALPNAGQAWLAPLAAAALFWAWQRLSYKRGFFAGWFAGIIYFAISFSWFTYTVGSDVGIFAFAIVLIPAIVFGLTFGLSAVFTRLALQTAPAWIGPLAFAAIFTVLEWARSISVVGVPFAQVGYSQTSTLLGLFAAYIGAIGVTFVVMLIGGSIAHAVLYRDVRLLTITAAALCAAWFFCYAQWPARTISAPTVRVAIVQGNVPQSLKSTNLDLSVNRYTGMTRSLAPLHPALVVWPETVILTELDEAEGFWNAAALTPAQRSKLASMVSTGRTLFGEFGRLAKSLNTTIMVGSLDRHWGVEGLKGYNAIYTYGPDGTLRNIYDKRQLVPFAESLPAPGLFSWLPYADLIGRYGHGTDDTVIPVGGLTFAPLICWESAFSDLVHRQLERGAQVLVIPTDDAWFGPTSGTYQHAQIAQMRAMESGTWVVQAASTGISGIIAPDGTWRESLGFDKQGVVVGNVGKPSGSLFARIGPTPVVVAVLIVYLAIVGGGLAVRARAH